MTPSRTIFFETHRLIVRLAEDADVDMFYAIWTNPDIMVNMGFPNGLPITREKISARIAKQGTTEFSQLLVVERKSDGCAIGECKMSLPNEAGVSVTDVKLLPEFWGNHYGVEVKQGLLDHMFTHTDCTAVEVTPNVGNIASVKMQEAVGGVCVGEDVYQFPDSMRSYTASVHHYIYRVTREVWESRRAR